MYGYIVFPNTNAFNALFDYLRPRALKIIYWKGEQQTSAEKPKRYSGRESHIYPPFQSKPGPIQKVRAGTRTLDSHDAPMLGLVCG